MSPDNPVSQVFHKDHLLVCQWFISLARLPGFSSAQWKDAGSAAHLKFILAKSSSHTPTEKSTQQPCETGSTPVQKAGVVKAESKSSAHKRGGPQKGNGQGEKGQQNKAEPKQSQQPVSGF
jgi:hypothetical protein